MKDEDEETLWEYVARSEYEKLLPVWEDMMEWEREKDREMLRHIKAVEAKREEQLLRRRQLYADNKGRNTN